jgi:hypothetical protein
MRCISEVSKWSASVTMASGLPPKGRLVKTSTR